MKILRVNSFNGCIDKTTFSEESISVIGGECNVINAGGICSFIGGGAHNTVSGNFSSILGGQNNNDGGFANAHIAGSGIALGPGVGNPNSLHINGLWANGIPFNPLFATPGTVFALAPGALPLFPLSATGGVLWIA